MKPITEMVRIDNETLPIDHGPFQLDDDDFLLYGMLTDAVYMPELMWKDPRNFAYGGQYRVRDYQYIINRLDDAYAIVSCARSVGKTESEKVHAEIHPLKNYGNLLITAPELIHLLPLTDAIENNIHDNPLVSEMLDRRNGQTGFQHRPFQCNLVDGTKIVGRIPKRDGTGVKAQHQKDLIVEEGQDYPERGWTEVNETVNYDSHDQQGKPDFHYWIYGVHSGNKSSGFDERVRSSVYRKIKVTALRKPDWNKSRKENAIASYGGTSSPDYKRNILGEPGAGATAYFVTARVMACFLGSTSVQTLQGMKRIDAIVEGDKVLTATGTGRVRRVRKTTRGGIAVVKLNTGEEIVCSAEHPFLTQHGWCHADRLSAGDDLYQRAETLRAVRQVAQDASGSVLLKALRRTLAWGSARGEDGSGSVRSHEARMREPGLREAVRAFRRGKVLLARVHGGSAWRGEEARAEGVRGVWRRVSTAQDRAGALLSQVRDGQGLGGQYGARGSQHAIHAQGGARRLTVSAVQALASPWRDGERLVRPVLHCADGAGAGGDALRDGHRFASAADNRRGGRAVASAGDRHLSQGSRTGRLAHCSRVASVSFHEPGSEEWARHCGGADSVVLYDLVIDGHPSFAVGTAGVVVHNCVDQNITRGEKQGSDYNENVYVKQTFRAEELDDLGMEIGDLLDLPDTPTHGWWGGVDIGLTDSPTVITLWADWEVGKKQRVALMRRYTLERFRPRQIRETLYAITWHLGSKLMGIGIDVTGLGQPIFQEMEDDELCPPRLKAIAAGYTFNSKVEIGVARDMVTENQGVLRDHLGNMVKEVEDEVTGEVRLVVMQPFIAASTAMIREEVDSGAFLIPFDTDVTSDMLQETRQRIERVGQRGESGGGAAKKGDRFHILDSIRAAFYRRRQDEIMSQLASPPQTSVFEIADNSNQLPDYTPQQLTELLGA